MDPSDILHLQIDQLLQGLVGQVYKANPKNYQNKTSLVKNSFEQKRIMN